MINAVIYARVSTEEQGDGYSLPTQIEACQNLAHDKNYQVIEIFQDTFTGTQVNRPALDELEKFVSNNDVQKLIVYEIDRFSRDSDVFGILNYKFRRLNLSIEYVKGDHNDSPSGKMVQHVFAAIAGFEKEQILERMKRGKQGKAKSGSVIVGARPPYGFKRVSKEKKVWFEIDEEEAKFVHLIFTWYLKGDSKNKPLSQNQIAKKLTALKVITRGDKNLHVAKKFPKYSWQSATIRKILTREAYTGYWYYGKTMMANGKQVPRPRSEWIAVPVPQIIAQEEFDQAKVRMQINIEQSKRNKKNLYLMGSRIKCSKCGYSYVGRTRRPNNQYYFCNGKAKRPYDRCDMPQFRADKVNDTVWNWIENLLLNPSNLAQGLKENQLHVFDSNKDIKGQISILENQIEKNNVRINKLLELYLDGEIEKIDHNNRKNEYNQLNSELLLQKNLLVSELNTEELSDGQITEIEEFASQVRNGLKDASFETKRSIIDLFDVRGKLAIEDNQRIIYKPCKLEKPQRLLIQTSHLSNIGG